MLLLVVKQKRYKLKYVKKRTVPTDAAKKAEEAAKLKAQQEAEAAEKKAAEEKARLAAEKAKAEKAKAEAEKSCETSTKCG